MEPVSSHSTGDLYHEVEELRVVILSRLDELNGMREDILANYVPVSVCHNLEQCIRETEVSLLVSITCHSTVTDCNDFCFYLLIFCMEPKKKWLPV